MSIQGKANAAGIPARIAAAAAVVAMLAACGGGGSGDGLVRADPPPAAPPPAPPLVLDPDPAYSGHLAQTGASGAHAAGYTGAGIRIGIVDSGVNRNHPALAGRVVANLNYINPNTNNLAVDDVVGHGTAVAQAAAGRPFGAWPGGIAPGAEIVSARIISDRPPEDDGSGEGNEVDGPLGLAGVHRDLISRGVRIMNNSWGGLYWTNPAATAGIASEYRPFIGSHGGLVVFSTGNSGFDDPSDMAALPSQPGVGGSLPAADLERGWLAVGALDRDDPTQLAAYSNACGIAMRYCMVAPGSVVVTGTSDPPQSPEYWRWSGTSFAAPLVSGAAALVWEAFPWFDNDLVRQTLLGTATDLGDPGVDPVFGYGALDAGAAVRGPGRFDWGTVTADFDGMTSTWSNFIGGSGGLVKRGTGTLVLTGGGDFTGATRVEEGTLGIDHGSVLASAVHVGSAGTLVGHGAVGALDNHGEVRVQTTLRVDGDFHQRPGGQLSLFLGDTFLVEGGAFLDGELHVLGAAGVYGHGSTVQVLTAREGVSGTFARLGTAPGVFLEGTLHYHDTRVTLAITRIDIAAAAMRIAGMQAAGLSSAARMDQVFAGIDGASGGSGAPVAPGVARVAGAFERIRDPALAAAALSSLSGEAHSLAAMRTFDAIDLGRRALASRFGDAAAGEAAAAGAWARTLGGGGRGGFVGGDASASGWMIGQDLPLGGGAFAGFSFGELHADTVAGDSFGRGRERQAETRAYAGRSSGAAYALVHAGGGRFDRDVQRDLYAGDAWQGVGTRYSGHHAAFGAEAGRHLRMGGVALTPWLGVDHVRIGSRGFREEGGEGFGLQARPWSARRSQAMAGLRASRHWGGLGLHGHVEWQHVLAAGGLEVEASFTGIDSWSPLPGLGAERDGGLFGVGMEARLSDGALLTLGLDQRFGPRGAERMASLRYAIGF